MQLKKNLLNRFFSLSLFKSADITDQTNPPNPFFIPDTFQISCLLAVTPQKWTPDNILFQLKNNFIEQT